MKKNWFSKKILSVESILSVDRGKNLLQQRETLPVPQVPIRLTNVWYGRLDGIMDPLPSKFVVWCTLKLKSNKRSQLSESKLF